ncbi:hypothetical protein Dsin_017620 [Dipteronia sinensis]|uniref:3-hydroxyisobutyryl-CoA hydrolase n=1 Tax=Dipteronia sinensis TaxID=43782 RepID=A0AAE0E6Q6_9ROSI|nr:hypothetical protein Dsin_017620 [Dipteronia sinensis]
MYISFFYWSSLSIFFFLHFVVLVVINLSIYIKEVIDGDDQVVFEGNSSVKKVMLNRPRKLNTLTHQMISQMTKRLEDYENEPEVKLVMLKGNDKAFCAGGDLVAIYKFLTAGCNY